jgi:hypothetical protein
MCAVPRPASILCALLVSPPNCPTPCHFSQSSKRLNNLASAVKNSLETALRCMTRSDAFDGFVWESLSPAQNLFCLYRSQKKSQSWNLTLSACTQSSPYSHRPRHREPRSAVSKSPYGTKVTSGSIVDRQVSKSIIGLRDGWQGLQHLCTG